MGPRKKYSCPVVGCITAVVAILVFIYGQGILLKPDIELTCGAVDVAIPVQLKLELVTMRLLTMAPEMQDNFKNDFIKALRELGLSEDKIAIITKYQKENVDEKGNIDIKKKGKNINLELKAHEQRIMLAALSKAMSNSMGKMGENLLNLPDGVVFFRVRNTGLVSAKEVHIIVRLNGTFCSERFESLNDIRSKREDGNSYIIDLDSLSPKSQLRGMIWYTRANSETLFKANTISVAHKDGIKEGKIEENLFFIND